MPKSGDAITKTTATSSQCTLMLRRYFSGTDDVFSVATLNPEPYSDPMVSPAPSATPRSVATAGNGDGTTGSGILYSRTPNGDA